MSLIGLSPERRREISSKGGKSIPAAKRSFSQNRELAREAGRKGGLTPRRTKVKLTSSEINSLADSVLAKLHVEPEDHG